MMKWNKQKLLTIAILSVSLGLAANVSSAQSSNLTMGRYWGATEMGMPASGESSWKLIPVIYDAQNIGNSTAEDVFNILSKKLTILAASGMNNNPIDYNIDLTDVNWPFAQKADFAGKLVDSIAAQSNPVFAFNLTNAGIDDTWFQHHGVPFDKIASTARFIGLSENQITSYDEKYITDETKAIDLRDNPISSLGMSKLFAQANKHAVHYLAVTATADNSKGIADGLTSQGTYLKGLFVDFGKTTTAQQLPIAEAIGNAKNLEHFACSDGMLVPEVTHALGTSLASTKNLQTIVVDAKFKDADATLDFAGTVLKNTHIKEMVFPKSLLSAAWTPEQTGKFATILATSNLEHVGLDPELASNSTFLKSYADARLQQKGTQDVEFLGNLPITSISNLTTNWGTMMQSGKIALRFRAESSDGQTVSTIPMIKGVDLMASADGDVIMRSPDAQTHLCGTCTWDRTRTATRFLLTREAENRLSFMSKDRAPLERQSATTPQKIFVGP